MIFNNFRIKRDIINYVKIQTGLSKHNKTDGSSLMPLFFSFFLHTRKNMPVVNLCRYTGTLLATSAQQGASGKQRVHVLIWSICIFVMAVGDVFV